MVSRLPIEISKKPNTVLLIDDLRIISFLVSIEIKALMAKTGYMRFLI